MCDTSSGECGNVTDEGQCGDVMPGKRCVWDQGTCRHRRQDDTAADVCEAGTRKWKVYLLLLLLGSWVLPVRKSSCLEVDNRLISLNILSRDGNLLGLARTLTS